MMRRSIQKKDSFQGKAKEDYPWRRPQGKQNQRGQPYNGNSFQEKDRVHREFQEDFSPAEHVGLRPKSSVVAWRDPARLSSLIAGMESLEHNRKLAQSIFSPRPTSHPIPEWRSRLSIRLHLLWLNFFLIPTRIHYMLRHKDRGPYKRSIITGRGSSQWENWWIPMSNKIMELLEEVRECLGKKALKKRSS